MSYLWLCSREEWIGDDTVMTRMRVIILDSHLLEQETNHTAMSNDAGASPL